MIKMKKLPVRLLALSDAQGHQRAHRLIKIKNCHSGKWVKKLIPSSLVNDMRKLREFLTDAGLSLDVSESDFKQIVNHLRSLPKGRVTLCMRPGFVNVDGSQCYLTGSGEVFGEYLEHPPMPHPDSQAFKNTENPKGTLKQWQTNVAPCALHSPYIMLALCSAIAGYCINFTDFESGGFHLYGDSSRGKTTALLVAASVISNDEYICDWNLTETAFEELAESRNHSLLILDELGLLDKNKKEAAQKMQKLIYLLGSGGGKQRSINFQKHKALWRVNAISNGESGLAQHAAEGDMLRKKGEQARFIDVPVDCENDLGIFTTLPEGIMPSDYAEVIKENCQRYHGTAGPALLEKLLDKTPGILKERIDKHVRKFLKIHNVDGLNGFEKRMAKRFALAYASGIIAVRCKIFPFNMEDVMYGISWCYAKACYKAPLKEEVFTQTLKDALKNDVYIPSKSQWDVDRMNEMNVIAHAIGGVEVLAVKAEFLKENIIGDYKQVIVGLIQKGCLYPDAKGRATRQLGGGGNRLRRRYCLKINTWDSL
ncbi:DUF927 domain-containing protein [Pantoea sp. EA-12]|uniref:DUF927 domain-containing protein n=1 Tax=Pantoea sp. EA-12 TaxID=3043303 RepID=UPI0024B4932D|nr:DUF927 domain-containing protein [Pantoea sp. EA-12]MDI9222657.1 DUF927 domain-containing protein [Pantoea sp. EA-12]